MADTTNYVCPVCGKPTYSGDVHTCSPQKPKETPK